MKKTCLWTQSKARLQLVQAAADSQYNWLFIPGGPGLGSESLNGLAEILDIPGNIWHVDFPGDGSNTTSDDEKYFSHWSQALIEVTRMVENVILVAHSSGGMFSLATPEIEKNIIGLVLMDSAPDASWQTTFATLVEKNPIPEAEKLQAAYEKNPSNQVLKELTIACAPYFSTKQGLRKIISLLESVPFNYKTHQWAAEHFDQTYKAKWVPQTIPTLIFAGEYDHLTPLKLFLDSADFQRDNIVIREVADAAHFPWLDNPEQVKKIFNEYYREKLNEKK